MKDTRVDRRRRRAIALTFVCLATISWARQPSTGQGLPPPAPLVRENATVKLPDHVWAIPDFNVGLVPNVGIIVGNKATLVVDTGLGPRNGDAIVREMKKVSANADVYVVTTHYHPEHSLGAGAFKGAKLLMTRIQQQDMTELGKTIQDAFASRSALNAELLNGVPYPTPDILFDREYRIDLGGVHARLLWRGPAAMHTRGDTMIFIEEDRVLFTGDVVMSQRFLAAQNTSSITTWLSTLDELAALMRRDLELTRIQVGLVFSAFAYSYAAMQIVGGWAADRFGPRLVLSALSLLWATATILTGLSWSVGSLLAFRLLVGVGEGGAFPAAT